MYTARASQNTESKNSPTHEHYLKDSITSCRGVVLRVHQGPSGAGFEVSTAMKIAVLRSGLLRNNPENHDFRPSDDLFLQKILFL
jgi:hypothetical protein